MVKGAVRRSAAVLLGAMLFLSSDAAAEGQAAGKILPLDNVTISFYALGGDVATLKDPVEAVYVFKGDAAGALFGLKETLIEGRKEQKTFRIKDPLCIVVFRGFFPGLSKVFIKKVTLEDCKFDIYAEYWDRPEYSTPSQPAAIIPVGQLPPGDYTINLFVGNELRKNTGFKIRGR
ncbi:MAG: hypothetical protein WCY23_02680 [Candidatus Omnitrophota bacterium]